MLLLLFVLFPFPLIICFTFIIISVGWSYPYLEGLPWFSQWRCIPIVQSVISDFFVSHSFVLG